MISWVEEELETMSDKGFFEKVMSEKIFSFQKLIFIAPTSLHAERLTKCVNDWRILNNDWPNQKIDLHQYLGVYTKLSNT